MFSARASVVVLVLVVLASAVTAKLQPESDSPGERFIDPPGFSNGRATRRYIVGLEASSPRSRAQARAAVTATITAGGGDVVLESVDEDNPFVVFEASSAEHASAIAQLARTTRGATTVERDAIRYPMGRRLASPADIEALLAASSTTATAPLSATPSSRSLLQTAIQPYGITAVQASLYASTNRSTTSSVDATKKFPICVIDSGYDSAHPAFSKVRLMAGEPAGFNVDTCGHGSHVLGTIGGSVTLDGVLNGGVDVVIVQVFTGGDCRWTYSSTLSNAMSRCKTLGAKIISMSLGGTRPVQSESNQASTLYNGGMLLIAAACNDGNSKTSYPAGYSSVVSVAAVDANNVKAGFSQTNSDVEIAAPGVGVLSCIPVSQAQSSFTVSMASGTTINTIDGQMSFMDFSPVKAFSGLPVQCTTTSCPAGTTGKVCIIPRGDISFCDKVVMCANAGGVAAIIYNNVAGAFGGTLSSTCAAVSSTISSLALAQELAPSVLTGGLITGTIGSPYPYAYYDGTSMATPHVSAVAAMVWGAKPTCSNAHIRCILDRTARDLGIAGKDTSFGYGLVQAKAAIDRVGCSCTL